jgi:caffeoyl-CoA O-methyltransferase
MTGDPARRTDYVEGLFAREDPLLAELRAEIPRRGFPEIAISAEVGRLLQVLLVAVGARRVLELGTLGGYSAIWMARVLPAGGRLLTVELDADRAELAREYVARAGLEDRVEVMVGDAVPITAGLVAAGEAFDAVFIDADKEGYGTYLDRALELVRPGGLILADNAFRSDRVLDPEPDDHGVRVLQDFNRRLAGHPDLVATIVPVRDGLAVAVVDASPAGE